MPNIKEFENFEQQFIELVGEFKTLSVSTSELRESVHTEAARAEAAEASRDACERATAHAQNNALASSASATQALQKLATTQEELTAVKMQLEFAERQRCIFEEKYVEILNKTTLLERELQTLRPFQEKQSTLQRQYGELQEQVQKATEDVQSEVSRLENELKRVERCASAGVELRERARLAAAAHARQKRQTSTDLQHLTQALQTANAEISRQTMLIAELEYRLSKSQVDKTKKEVDPEHEALIEAREALEAERVGTQRLEKALAAATADNAYLARELHKIDNKDEKELTPECSTSTNINCPIDWFLAD